jgi:uncharacterized protein (DUF2132 family)
MDPVACEQLWPDIKGQNPSMHEAPPDTAQPRNPLHGVTLETIVRALEAHYGWADLAKRIPVRCFSHDPSLKSSLKFLRKTPWARERAEGLYLFMLREERRMQRLPRPEPDLHQQANLRL